jgi:hypothetical protein
MKKLILLTLLLSNNLFAASSKDQTVATSEVDECKSISSLQIADEEKDEMADKCKEKYEEEKSAGREPSSVKDPENELESPIVDAKREAHDCYQKTKQEDVDSCLDGL